MLSAEELDFELRKTLGLPAVDPASEDADERRIELADSERAILSAAPQISSRDYEAYRLFQKSGGRDGAPINADLKAAWNQEDRRRKLVLISTADEQKKREALAAILADSVKSAHRAERAARGMGF